MGTRKHIVSPRFPGFRARSNSLHQRPAMRPIWSTGSKVENTKVENVKVENVKVENVENVQVDFAKVSYVKVDFAKVKNF